MAKKKKFSQAVFAAALVLILSLGALFLPWSGRAVKKGIEMALRSLDGLSGSVESVSGNPLSGYVIKGLVLKDAEGLPLIRAGSLRVFPDLRALLHRKIRLPEIQIHGVRLDEKRLFSIKIKKPGTREIAVEMPVVKVFDAAPFRGDWAVASAVLFKDTDLWRLDAALTWKGLPLRSSLGLLTLGDSWYLRDGSVRFLDGAGVLSGDILPELNLSGTLTGLNLEGLAPLFPNSAEKYCGKADLDWHVWGEPHSPSARGLVRLDKAAAGPLNIPGLEAGWTFENGILSLEDLRSLTPGPEVSGDGALRFTDPLSVRADLRVRNLDLGFWLPKAAEKSRMAGSLESLNLRFDGPLDGSDLPAVSGDLISRVLTAWGVPLTDISAVFSGGGKELMLPSFSACLGDGKITGSGSVLLDKRPKITAKGAFSGFSGQGLAQVFPALGAADPAGNLSGNWSLSLDKDEIAAEAGISSPSLNLAGAFPLSELKGTFCLSKEALNIKDLSAGLYGGRLSLNGTLCPKSGALNINGKLASADGGLLLGTMGGIDGKGFLDGEITLSGSVSSPVLNLAARSSGLELASLTFNDLILTMKTDEDCLRSELQGTLSGVPVTGGGWVRLPSGGGRGEVNLRASVNDLDLKNLIPRDVKMGGVLSARLHLLGPLGRTKLYGRGGLARLQVGNMSFASVDVGGYLGTGGTLDLRGSAQFGDRRLRVSCDLLPLDEGWSLDFSASGKDMDLASLAPALEGAAEGRLDLDLKGSWSGGAIAASGAASSPGVSSGKIRIGPLSLPLEIQGQNLRVKGGRAAVYGGSGTVDLDVDLGKNMWKGRSEVKSADLGALIRDGAALPGTIDGVADLRLDLSGVAGKAFLVNLSGFFKARSLELRDFAVLQPVTRGEPLRIRDLSANFGIDGKELYILPGSRASAWPGDKVFRYLEVSGTAPLGDEGELDLSFAGEINLNALNAFLGAMKNVFKATIENLKDPRSLATDLLKGLIGGYSSREFREIRLHLGGRWDSPVISKLRISEKGGAGSGGMTESELPSLGGEPRIMIKIDIPTGRGAGAGPEAADQVKQQLMQQLLEQVVGGQ